MSDQIFYLFSALLLGLVLGALIMYFATGSNKDSEQTIAKLEKELENYQQDVVDHFEQTADLVDGMTQSYKKVFDHLGKSARKLMTEDQIQKQLDSRRGNKVTLEYLNESDEEHEIFHSESLESIETDELIENDIIEDKNEESQITESNENIEDNIVETNSNEDELSEEVAQLNAEKPEGSQEDHSDTEEKSEKDLEKEVEMREKNIYS